MSEEFDKDKIEQEVKEEVIPSTEEPEKVDTTSELPADTEVSSSDEGEKEDTTTDGGDGGGTPDEVSTEQSDSDDKKDDGEGKEEKPLDTEEEKDLPVQEGEEEIEKVEEDTPPIPPIDVEALQREVEDLKYEKETNEAISSFHDLVAKQQKEYDEFNQVLQDKIVEEFDRYGIDPAMDVETLKTTDPAKYQILQNILLNAKSVSDKVTADIQAPIQEAADDIVFRVAGKELKNYELTQDQAKEAVKTFVTIMNETGIRDLKDDLKAKVELSVAKAKMIVKDEPKVEPVKEEKKIEEKKNDVPKEEPVKTEGKKLEDFTKGVSPGIPPKGPEVNSENVLTLYTSKQGKERLAFFAEHRDLIMSQLSKGGMSYTDNARRW